MAAAPDWKDQIKKILSTNGNDKCADCGVEEATWAVHNLGVFVCIKCSGVHRQLGVHVSKVKSTEYDKWTQEQLDYVRERGNTRVNPILEANLPAFVLRPNESPNDSVRFIFIQNKYANQIYSNTNDPTNIDNINNIMNNENKDNSSSDDNAINNIEMPMKLNIFEFLHETKKKRLYFQLLTNYLYYFRYSHDSYSFEHYDVTQLNVNIINSNENNNHNEPCIEIKDLNKQNSTIFTLRSTIVMNNNNNNITDQNKVENLLIFVEKLNQAKLYYNSDVSKEQKFDHEPGLPKKQFNEKDLNDGSCTVLGYAHKKGGGARNWRKRWWILDNGILYYFKDDFRTSYNKKSKGIGVPQGDIGLLYADITWDKNKKRTNKDNALLIATHKRTFYIQPTPQNYKQFYEAVESCCDHMWNRHTVNFANIN